RIVVELAVGMGRGDLDREHDLGAGAGQQADEQQAAVTVGEAGPAPDVGEQVVGGVAEEVAGTVGHLEAVDLLHLLQPAAALLGKIVELAHQSPSPFARFSRASCASGTSTSSVSASSIANARS